MSLAWVRTWPRELHTYSSSKITLPPTYLPTNLSTYLSIYLSIRVKPPTTPIKQPDLPRDLRLQAQTLKEIGCKYTKIAEHLKITLRQIQYACSHRSTP